MAETFEAAVLEVDQAQLLQKIEAARAAIDARISELISNADRGPEEYVLHDALMALNDLQSISNSH